MSQLLATHPALYKHQYLLQNLATSLAFAAQHSRPTLIVTPFYPQVEGTADDGAAGQPPSSLPQMRMALHASSVRHLARLLQLLVQARGSVRPGLEGDPHLLSALRLLLAACLELPSGAGPPAVHGVGPPVTLPPEQLRVDARV